MIYVSLHDFREMAHTNSVKMKRAARQKLLKVPDSYRISMPDTMWRECRGAGKVKEISFDAVYYEPESLEL